MHELPTDHFSCILADPPWAFRTFGGENMTPHRCAEDDYRTMTFEQMAALPVGERAAKDCVLFMWVSLLSRVYANATREHSDAKARIIRRV